MANVIVINPFEVPKGKEKEALAIWEKFADYFCKQPGYVSTRLHRAVNPDARFHLVSISEWASAEQFGAALQNPQVKAIADATMEDLRFYPSLYEVIRT
ncbi:MAG: antibiotic biosynthesis monooxygenase [Nitrospirae bacterium]|nr:antibiotic biosynthesis monooxygenase [Nitrospirota bacterium]